MKFLSFPFKSLTSSSSEHIFYEKDKLNLFPAPNHTEWSETFSSEKSQYMDLNVISHPAPPFDISGRDRRSRAGSESDQYCLRFPVGSRSRTVEIHPKQLLDNNTTASCKYTEWLRPTDTEGHGWRYFDEGGVYLFSWRAAPNDSRSSPRHSVTENNTKCHKIIHNTEKDKRDELSPVQRKSASFRKRIRTQKKRQKKKKRMLVKSMCCESYAPY